MAQTRIGISGWRYGPWRGTFYPKDLPQKRELEFASRQVNSIEINGSFYSLQHVQSWQRWHDQTPDDFVFSVKGGRFITHMKKLKDVDTALANFFAQGVLALKEKLGPILWQFPPGFAFNCERFEAFFHMLPRNTEDALKLARKRNQRMKGRSLLKIDESRKLRHAVEIRHDSFKCEAFVKLLRDYDIVLVVADTAGKWPFLEDLTSDFVYARLHGDEQIYVSGYTPEALDRWAARVTAWRDGREIPDAMHASDVKPKKKRQRDVYVYFDNDVKVRAPFDAMNLAQRVGGYVSEHAPSDPPENVSEQARTSWAVVRK